MLKFPPQNQALSEALEAEMSGNHSLAFDILSPFWKDVNEFPSTTGLSDTETAEVFLRCGSIAGFLGRSKRIANAQEISRKLLNEAITRFEHLEIDEKIAECENFLALTFERVGAISEARDHLERSFEIELDESHPTRLYSHIIKSLLDLANKDYLNIISDFAFLESVFQTHANLLFKGSFYNNYGLALKNLGRIDEALEKLLTARYYFTKAEYFTYCGLLENNLARLYCQDKRYLEAHHFAQKADNTYKLVGDISRRGDTLNTRAEIFLDEEDYENALDFSKKSLKLLENDENLCFIVRAYKTKINALTKMGKNEKASQAFNKALEIAEQLGEQKFKEFTQEFAQLFIS